ncbi:hypothetical protein BJ742DRAFT_759552 [Cladochytrium replicatum]|nr:hypothetical protein BJ742DRAFT_759552 [Cladochytrium replicatum]
MSSALGLAAARRSIARAQPLFRSAAVRNNSTSSSQQAVPSFSWANFKTFLPAVNTLTGKNTVGDLVDVLWTKYRYRAAYPVIAWVAFLYWNMWGSYTPDSEKAKVRAREEKLKSLEYRM